MSQFRLGLLVPSSNTTMEQEFRLTLPRDISIHIARLRLHDVVVAELLTMEKQITDEALKLADADVNVIGFGCTSGSLAKGLGHDKEIVKQIEKTTEKPAVATAGAVTEAFESLKLKRVAVGTPYVEEINRLERAFLEQNGFIIEKMIGLGLTDNLIIGRLTSETVLDLARQADSHRAEGTFLSCTNMPTLDVVAKLEKTLRKPVVSSNTATLWAMLKRIGYSLHDEKLGKLFF